MQKIFWRVVCCAIVLCLILLGVFYRPLYKFNYYTNSDVVNAQQVLWEDLDIQQKTLTKQEYKTLVEQELHISHYVLIEKDTIRYKDAYGYAMPLIRTVVLKKDLNAFYYTQTLTHELIHIKYFSADERFVDYMTFRTLYESNNEYLHNMGVIYGIMVVEDYIKPEYSCKGQLVNYLKEKI